MGWLERLNLENFNLPWLDDDLDYQLRGKARSKDGSERFNYDQFKQDIEQYIQSQAKDPNNLEITETETENRTQKLIISEEDRISLELTYVDIDTYLTAGEEQKQWNRRGRIYTEDAKIELEASDREILEDFALHLNSNLPYDVTFSGNYSINKNSPT